MKTLAILTAVLLIVGAAVATFWMSMSQSPALEMGGGTEHVLLWPQRTTIDTPLGPVTGLSNGRVQAFLGLRYAQAPIKEKRFLPPAAVRPWQGTYDATALPPVAMQSESSIEGFTRAQMSEDSLFLNIFTPSPQGTQRPVLLWIHGGSFMTGGSNSYDGSVLAEQGDVVVVVINYRLGMFGFLDLSAFGSEFAGSAANGIRDQVLALQWVRDNIASYGGDANNVTIFGESAGGQSVLAIIATPSADGLYHKAIVHSGASVKAPPEDVSRALADHLDVERSALPETLRALSADDLLAAQEAVSFSGGGTIDGTVTTRSSNAAIVDRGADGVPLLAGSNRNEGTLFSYLLPSALYGFIGDAVAGAVLDDTTGETYLANLDAAYPEDNRTQRFERIWTELLRHGATDSAVRASAAGPGGWLYRFDMPAQGANEALGATHAAEIAFTFNQFASEAPTSSSLYDRNDEDVRRLALNWSNTIIRFARTGDPNGAGLPTWPRYTAEHRETLILDSQPRVEAFLDAADRQRWGDDETTAAELLR